MNHLRLSPRQHQAWRSLFLVCLLTLAHWRWATAPVAAQSSQSCVSKVIVNGLGDNRVNGVYASGSTVYAATAQGLSISTDGGLNFSNKTTADGLGSNFVNGVYASGSTVYAATAGGLSSSTDGGLSFSNKTTADGLGNNTVWGVYASGSTVYAATEGAFAPSPQK